MSKRKKISASQLFDQSIEIGKERRKRKAAEAKLQTVGNLDSVPVDKLMEIRNHFRRMYMEHYDSAKTGRWENDWLTSTDTPYNDISGGLSKMIARSRRLVSNSGFAGNAVNVMVDNVVCDGLRPIPIVKKKNGTPDERVNGGLREQWAVFNDTFDRSGRSTFYECQRLALTTIIVSGSVITIQVPSNKKSEFPIAYQMREPDRLDTSKDYPAKKLLMEDKTGQIVHGIKLNEYDEPIEYYFNGLDNPLSAQFVTHAFKRMRPEQYTGVPWFAAVLKKMWDVDNLIQDQSIKSRMAAMIALWFEGDNSLPAIGKQNADDDTFSWYPGAVGRGPAGSAPKVIQAEDLEGGYTTLIKMLLRETAAAVGLSYYSIARDIEGMNFAGTRAVILDERRMFQGAIKWFSKEYCQPHYKEFVKWCAITGRVPGLTIDNYLREPHRYNDCYWVPRPWEWVDPVSDVQALIKLKEAGWYTDEMYLAARGIGVQEFYEQLKKEKTMKADAGLGAVSATKDPDNGTEKTNEDKEKEEKTAELNLYRG